MLVGRRRSQWLAPPAAVAALLCTWFGQAAAESCAPVARVVSIQGTVQIKHAGQDAWSYVRKLDTPVCQGDLLHTEAASRAALLIVPETLVRLDQNSTMAIKQTAAETIVELSRNDASLLAPDQCGAGYFITRFPRRFRVLTPFVNASVEGTEFLVAMRCESTQVAVFEGRVRAQEVLAESSQAVSLKAGEGYTAGGNEPPVVKVLVKPVDAVQWALYYPPLSEAGSGAGPDQQCDRPAADERARCLTARAEQRLRVGRADDAQSDIEASVALVPDNADAQALSSVINVAKNDKLAAIAFGQQATRLAPVNPRTWIALSYAQQASFKLEDALASAEHAAEVAPGSATAQARVAELLLSLGRTKSSERAARAAVAANPNESRANTILGFVHLAQIDTRKAREDFLAAIERDSSDPLPRLGLGLAMIREGHLATGREQIEIAVALDPTNSLIRSYAGKAYYEENTKARGSLAATQFGIAKQLDPQDPTPWFYDAILKQTQNRPVEALENLQKSIALNDNRAVYRSKLLLDQDQAARGASLAQVYQDLGFQQLAVSEAYSSIERDPGNSAAHRFLSDAYTNLPRHQIAQTSELLQSELRQPLSLDPIPAQRSEANLAIPRGSGPISSGLYELNPLFVSQGAALSADALGGEMNTIGGQTTLALLGDKAAARAGVFHYETSGFRDGNDLNRTVANSFFQLMPSPDFSAQVELRTSDLRSGDLPLRFDPTFVLPTTHNETQDSVRIGARYVATPNVDFVVSGIWQHAVNVGAIEPFALADDLDSTLMEAQSLIHYGTANITVGAGRLDGTLLESTLLGGTPVFTNPENKRTQENEYVYASVGVNRFVRSIELGLSADYLSEAAIHRSEVNPKLGLVLSPAEGTTVRAAYIRSVRRILPTEQTIEPTQVAGFNQLFADPEGTIARRAGIGLDQQLSSVAFAGLEWSKRDLTVPFIDFFSGTSRDVTWKEKLARAYLYWAVAPQVALTGEIYYERYERPAADPGEEQLVDLHSWHVPVGATVFLGERWTARAAWTYWRQEGTFLTLAGTTFPGREDFSVVDVQLAYRLPARRGFLIVGANNLFDSAHNYQESDLSTPRYIPERFAYVRIDLAF